MTSEQIQELERADRLRLIHEWMTERLAAISLRQRVEQLEASCSHQTRQVADKQELINARDREIASLKAAMFTATHEAERLSQACDVVRQETRTLYEDREKLAGELKRLKRQGGKAKR